MTGYALYLLVLVLEVGLLAASTDLLGGHGGRMGVTSVFFASISGYLFAALSTFGHLSPLLAICSAGALSLLLASAISPLLLRLHPFSFLLATFGLEILFIDIARNVKWTGGPFGLREVPFYSFPGFQDATRSGLALLLVGLLICLAIGHFLLGSGKPWGLLLHAIRDDHESADAIGASAGKLLFQASLISALLASIAGIGATMAQGYIGPGSFGVSLCLTVIATVFLSGTGSAPYTMFIGALLLVTLGELLAKLFVALPEAVGPAQQIAFNAVLILVLFWWRRGFFGSALEEGPSTGAEE